MLPKAAEPLDGVEKGRKGKERLAQLLNHYERRLRYARATARKISYIRTRPCGADLFGPLSKFYRKQYSVRKSPDLIHPIEMMLAYSTL